MTGTIYSGTYVTGIVLDDPATQLPATVTGSVSNQDGDAIYGKPGARWTVANSGTIQSTGSTGYGIDLVARGTVENGDSGAAAALISGYGGVVIRGKLATVANYATIEGTGSKRNGVELRNGGRVTNGGTGAAAALISGGASGVNVNGASGTVTNFGTIEGGRGVALRAGGRVTNGSAAATAALISATRKGIYISGIAGTVTNFGTIQGPGGVNLTAGGTVVNLGTITGAGSEQAAVGLQAGGKVANGSAAATGALISGVRYGVYIADAAGTVRNFGILTSTGTYDTVGLFAGGSVTNGSATSTAALISGDGEGVLIAGATGTVTNFGTIEGGNYSVRLTSGGRVTNGSATSTAALIDGDGEGVLIASFAGTVANFGTIQSGYHSVVLSDGGRITNGSATSTAALIGGTRNGVYISGAVGAVTNFGTIEGDFASYSVVLSDGGRITNGSAASTSALIGGVLIASAAGTVTNFGTIQSGYYSVVLSDGGRVTNGSAASTNALISGYYDGVVIAGAVGTVTNFGTIIGYETGVLSVSDSGRVTNGSTVSTKALIYGGVYISGAAGTVTNFGTIQSQDGHGVFIHSGVTVNNFGTISGGGDGVYVDRNDNAGVTVTNFGTISGGYDGFSSAARTVTVTNFGAIGGGRGAAVRISAGVAGKVVAEPGAVFVGSVLGGGMSEIDFVAGGVADVGNVSGFATIGLSNGRPHTLTVTGANFAAVVGAAITVDDGDSGNTVTAATLPAKDRIIVHAGTGLDKLTGGRGNDVFFAGGDTMMTGKAGTNEFVFSAPGGNTVGDFAVSATNEIVFSNKGFSLGLSGATGTPKVLPEDLGLFVENNDGHFTDANQRFAYATGSGDLFYSASGNSGTPSLVSHFTSAPALAASQLFFIT